MEFPWDVLPDLIFIPLLLVAIPLVPYIVIALIGQIIRLIGNLFGEGDDDI